MMPKMLQNDPGTGSLLSSYLLRFNFYNDTVYKSNPDTGMTAIVKGMTLQQAQNFDQVLTHFCLVFKISFWIDTSLAKNLGGGGTALDSFTRQ
jgi:hypothetical protein